MKKLFSLFLGLFILSCAEEKTHVNKVFNPFEITDEGLMQFFHLDTIVWTEITGKYGTKIYFDRTSFNVKGKDSITLELIELYDIQDLIKNNIRTITDDNELLETSGVLFLNFKRNGENIDLAGNSKIKVRFPVKLSGEDKIFNGEMDSTGQISWSESESYFTVLRFDETYQIDIPYEVTLDSLPHYQELWRKQDSIYEQNIGRYDRIEKRIETLFSFNKLGWINIDKFVEQPTKMNLTLTNLTEVEGLVIYVLYDNLNSFISFYPYETRDIFLPNVPVLNETYLVAVGIEDGELFAQKILVNQKRTINLDLKRISHAELNKLFEK